MTPSARPLRSAAALGALFSVLVAAPALAQDHAQSPPSTSDARALHERLLVLDTHLDTPANLVKPGWSILDRHSATEDGSQVDYPRMVEGGMDGGWWAVYSAQGPLTPEETAASLAVAQARIAAIRALTTDHPDKFGLALRAADAAPIAASGRRVVFISMENAYPLTGRPDQVQAFYDQGLRMISLVHFANNELADSATDPAGPRWHGLSPAGRRMVAQANRLGMVMDASHASDEVFDQLVAYSATPIILSHSGPRDVYDHPRNIDDARLRRLAASGGVIQINALGAYLKALPETPERTAAVAALRQAFGPAPARTPEQNAAYQTRLRALNRQIPPAQADFEDFIAHLLHALAVVGPRHVGVGADWDGGGGVNGMNDVSALPRITERLLAEGYSEDDIAAIWSGNALRLLRQAEDYAASRE
ncbi:dipeptidase [Brevundimonas sp. SORGH_AS_0993]|uniref:dipeptidase n=1 Tax=Brevundimonas sp. SORGH_AS_0993 TaxID=3041794 RepID=UPI00277EFB6E|nr:dipeptidase [Brevundimonas sp. SORGH_AS_0993]MDQ1155602.1 membrane dipeptidase [Brevundimonas sp. SORGH_AS_0993]